MDGTVRAFNVSQPWDNELPGIQVWGNIHITNHHYISHIIYLYNYYYIYTYTLYVYYIYREIYYTHIHIYYTYSIYIYIYIDIYI